MNFVPGIEVVPVSRQTSKMMLRLLVFISVLYCSGQLSQSHWCFMDAFGMKHPFVMTHNVIALNVMVYE